MKVLIEIGICLIIIVVLIAIGIETGIFDDVSEAFYDWFHPDPGPDLVFKPMEIRVRSSWRDIRASSRWSCLNNTVITRR